MALDLAALYRAERRQGSASMIYQEPAAPAARPSIYVQREQKPLQDYVNAAPSKHMPRAGESDQAYTARLKPLLHHLAESLPAAELETVAAAYNTAVEHLEGGQQTHQQLRTQLDSRRSGTGVDALGTPHQRAAALGGRFGARSIAGQGHVNVEALAASQPISASEVNVIMRQREEQRTQPQHTEVSTLRSSGAGFPGVNR